MVFEASSGMQFSLQRYVDGFETKVDSTFTLEKLLKELEYQPERAPFNIKIITGDEEKYEVEPNDQVGDVTAMMDNVQMPCAQNPEAGCR